MSDHIDRVAKSCLDPEILLEICRHYLNNCVFKDFSGGKNAIHTLKTF